MAGDVLITDTNFYEVVAGRPVQLRVTVGDAQPGGTVARLNGAALQASRPGEFAVGADGQNLAGSVLEVLTTVQDLSEAHNRTSVVHDLQGGVADQSFPFAVQVEQHKASARYAITFIFFGGVE